MQTFVTFQKYAPYFFKDNQTGQTYKITSCDQYVIDDDVDGSKRRLKIQECIMLTVVLASLVTVMYTMK